MVAVSDIQSYEDAATALSVSSARIRQLVRDKELVAGSIKGTVTTASVRVRVALLEAGTITLGRPKGSKNKNGDKKKINKVSR